MAASQSSLFCRQSTNCTTPNSWLLCAMITSKACHTLCDFCRVRLLQDTLCNADLINLGTISDLMNADCAMITPAELQASTQISEMSLACTTSACVTHAYHCAGRLKQ